MHKYMIAMVMLGSLLGGCVVGLGGGFRGGGHGGYYHHHDWR
jgi:hypothetical protein